MEELVCGRCKQPCHYNCGTGCKNLSQNARRNAGQSQFICPVCTVGGSNALLHKALTANQLFNEGKHSQDFVLADLNSNSEGDGDSEGDSGSENDDVGGDGGDVGGVNEGAGDRARVVDEEEIVQVPGGHGLDSLNHDLEELTPLHPSDMARSKRLSYILNTFKNFPDHVDTAFLTDSNGHGVDGKELDPEGRHVNVRSVGGLCVVSAARALKIHNKSYPRIKLVVWSVGVNDFLHRDQHCMNDYETYVAALYTESKRIFPNAEIKLVLPFAGSDKWSTACIKEFARTVKANCPLMKCYNPPSMRNRLNRDGVHLNKSGKRVFVDFLGKHFVPGYTNLHTGRSDNRGNVSAEFQSANFRVPSSFTGASRVPGVTYSSVVSNGYQQHIPRARQECASVIDDQSMHHASMPGVPTVKGPVCDAALTNNTIYEQSVKEVANALSRMLLCIRR